MFVKPRFKFLLAAFAFSLILAGFFTVPTFAAVGTSPTKAKYYVNNGSGSVGWHSQGATLTKDYYIWTDWKKSAGPTTIVMCKRSNPKSCWRSSSKSYGHAGTLWHRWGSDYFLVKDVSTNRACWSISKKKTVSKSYCKPGSFSGSNMRTHGVPQGYTRYGDYYLRGFGNYPGGNYITLYNKNKKKLADAKLPNWVNEIEDVMVDGDTGTVYFSTLQYVGGKKQVQFHKVNKSVFSKWIKPTSGSSSSSDDSSSSSDDSSSSGGGSSSSSDYALETDEEAVAYDPVAKQVTPNNDRSIHTSFFGDFKDDGNGCGTYMVLNFIIDILTYGIGIAAVIGIAVSGVTYLNARGNQERTTKAKRRLYEITIGVAAYAVLYTCLNVLLPGGKLNSNSPCSAATSVSTTGVNPWKSTYTKPGGDSQSSESSKSSSNTSKTSKDYQKAINDMALKLAWPSSKNSSKKPTPAFKAAWTKYVKKYDTGDSCHRNYGKSCGSFASTVLTAAGADAAIIKKKNYANSLQKYMSKSKKWKEIKKPEAGTVGLKNNGSGQWHVKIFVKYKGKVRAAEASHCDFWGKISSGTGRTTHVYRYVGK